MKNKMLKMGIQRRVITSILIVSILPLVAGLYLTYRDGTTTRRNSIGTSFQEIAKETAYKIDMIIEKEVDDVQRLAISPDVREAVFQTSQNNEELNNYLGQLVNYNEKEIYSLTVVDTEGKYITGVGTTTKRNYSNEKWFIEAFNAGRGKVSVGNLEFNKISEVYIISIAAPVMDNLKAMGVVVIKYNIDNLLEVITNVRIEKTGHANLVDSSGTIIMCPIFPPRSHQINPGLLNIIKNTKPGWGTAEDDAHGGENSIIGFAPVNSTLDPDNGWFDGHTWHIFIRQNPDETYEPIYSLVIQISIFGSALIILLSLAGVYATRKIVRPINQLYEGVGRIGQGDLDYRLNIKTNDEIEKLADEFNLMAGKLQETYSKLENRTTELETSEERYKDLIENSPEMIHSVDSNRFFVGVNKTELDILGYTLDEMMQMRIEDIMPEEFKCQGINHIATSRDKGVSTIEGQFISKDSRRIDVEITATACYHPLTGEFVRTRAFVRDITDRKKLEMQLKEYYEILEQKVQDRTRELKQTKDYLENLLETANDVIYTLNPDGIVTYVNKKIEEWGYTKDELIGKSFLTVFSKVHKGERFKKTVRDGIKQTYGVEVVSKTGEPKYAILSISPIRENNGIITEVLGIAKDITDQKMLEKQVADTEKMSAIGQLAAGVAHEVNNPLGGILNCLYNLRKNEFSEEKEEEYYMAMEDGIHRVKKIVSQLLDFSQQHEPEFTYEDINTLVENVFFLMNCTFSKNGITFKKKLSPRLPKLFIDKHKISQVLTNILINAVQATKEKGQITVRTTHKEGWCIIDIADSGPGIPEDIFPKIFDPFFTTKDVGEGTGLGLSVSRGIIEMHNGKIDVKSTAGVGAIFTIKLPIASPQHPAV
ncbi:MAG: PAS domain S-box protein [Deltaproteobacteria bacterium]